MFRTFVTAMALAVGCAPNHAAAAPGSVVVYGDSISLVGGGWPNELNRLLDGGGRSRTIVSRAINGNGLVWRTRCFGEPALYRLRADWPSIRAGDIVVLMAGVNDLIQPRLPEGYSDCFDPAESDSDLLISELAALATLARREGRRVLLATIPPYGRSEYHSAAAERDRLKINRWIRSNWRAGDIIDLDAALADPRAPNRLAEAFDSGDGLHPNNRGAAAIASAVAKLMR